MTVLILSGATGYATVDGLRIGKCRNVSLNVTREVKRNTKQGDYDHTYLKGIRDSEGSATIFYDPSDEAINALVSDLAGNDLSATKELVLVVDSYTMGGTITSQIIVTSMGVALAFGEAQVRDFQFKISGPALAAP